MPYKVNSTEVITDALVAQNMTYNNVHPEPSAITTAINILQPINTLAMGGPTTFTAIGLDTGRVSVLLLDTSTSNHAPTWPLSIKWPEGTEPTWGDYRYWQITLFCRSATVINGSAIGFTS